MSEEQAESSVILNRNKQKNNFMESLKKVEEETTNNALATQFPDWDLTPPATLLKRRSSKLL